MSLRRQLANKRKNVERNSTKLSDEDESKSLNELDPTSSKRLKTENEQRLHRYRSHMTKAIRDRIQRALHQRLYLLAVTKSSDDAIHREFKVLGNTANVYTVAINHVPSCTCPDHQKGNLCKHIIFVLHRVLKVDRKSPLLFQQALLTSELNEIFAKADAQYSDSLILAERSIREAYHAKTGDPNALLDPTKVQQKTVTNEDDCPICFEPMINDKDNIIFCSLSCGNNIHKSCFEQWQKAKRSMNESVTCPFCRVQWKTINKNDNDPNGYLNLAAYSTTHNYDDDDDEDDDDDDDYYRWRFYRRYYY